MKKFLSKVCQKHNIEKLGLRASDIRKIWDKIEDYWNWKSRKINFTYFCKDSVHAFNFMQIF